MDAAAIDPGGFAHALGLLLVLVAMGAGVVVVLERGDPPRGGGSAA